MEYNVRKLRNRICITKAERKLRMYFEDQSQNCPLEKYVRVSAALGRGKGARSTAWNIWNLYANWDAARLRIIGIKSHIASFNGVRNSIQNQKSLHTFTLAGTPQAACIKLHVAGPWPISRCVRMHARSPYVHSVLSLQTDPTSVKIR